MPTPTDILKQYWGFDNFRHIQEDIIQDVVDGKDTLGLLPTGGGKSICYQVAGLLRPGICIVISPLLALIQDQLDDLKNRGIKAETVNSTLKHRDMDRVLDNCIYGDIQFLFIAPERIRNELFLARATKMKIGMIAVDEAHCISQWGHEFRPAYRKIAELRELAPEVPVLALTATATGKVVADIQEQLAFDPPNIHQRSFARDNISFSVLRTEDKRGALIRVLGKLTTGSAIVYVRSRRKCKELAHLLQSEGIASTYYHAGLDTSTRRAVQDEWMAGKTPVVVSTNAFGMGIDKSNVRIVVHYDISDSIESYYQEAGRAGRDGEPSIATQLYAPVDIDDTLGRLRQRYPLVDVVKHVYQSLSDSLRLAAGSGELETFGLDLIALGRKSNLAMIPLLGSLRILEQNELLRLHEGLIDPSRLQIIGGRDEVDRLQRIDNSMGRMLHYLIRSRSGILLESVTISEGRLAKALKIELKALYTLLEQGVSRGLFDYRQRRGDSSITYLTPRIHPRDMRLNTKLMGELRDRAVHNQESLIRYFRNRLDCRAVQMLAYFDEDLQTPCGKCDVCRHAAKHEASAERAEILRSLRIQLAEPKHGHELEGSLQSNSGHRDEILRWAIDKRFIQMVGERLQWSGPSSSPAD